jgi:hypothetical protein
MTSDGTNWTGRGSVGGTRWTEVGGPVENSTLRGANGAVEGGAARPARKLPYILGGLVCIAIGVGIAVVSTRGDDSREPTPAAAPVAAPEEPAPADPVAAPEAAPTPAPPPTPPVIEVDAGVVESVQPSPTPAPVETKPTTPTPRPKPTIKKKKDVGESRI